MDKVFYMLEFKPTGTLQEENHSRKNQEDPPTSIDIAIARSYIKY